jgi:hypothetical protein
LKLQGDDAATPYAVVKAFWADMARGSLPVCVVPTIVPLGGPVIFVIAVPGLTPTSPVTTVVEGAVAFVTVVPARIAKLAAVPSPGAVDASAATEYAPTIRAKSPMDSKYRGVRFTAAG